MELNQALDILLQVLSNQNLTLQGKDLVAGAAAQQTVGEDLKTQVPSSTDDEVDAERMNAA